MRRFSFLVPIGLVMMCHVGLIFVSNSHAQATRDPLPSWNDGPAKQSVLDFVAAVTDESSASFVPLAERIATFDQDGTLWVEQPIYTQVVFAFDRVKTLAPKHPEWKTQPPFETILTGDRDKLAMFSIQDFEQVIAQTHAGMSVADFKQIVADWLATAKHPRFHRPYTELVYQPMLEVMRLLRSRGFKTYIVTGGGQDFVRTYAERVYGVPPEQVIGSAGQAKFEDRDGHPELIKLPKIMLIDDHGGKPEGINLVIGRQPAAAFGNSDGDRQMLEWAQAGGTGRLMMLVHHDDAEREYAYGAKSKIGTFPDSLMDEAHQQKWVVISMKHDWKRVFPFEK